MPVDRIGYGYGTYSDGDFGTEGVTHESGALSVSASSTVTAEGGISKFADALTSVTSTFTANGVRYREASATVTASASITSSGEGVIIERTDEFSYGMGLYGYNEYTQGDLQITITGTSSISCQARRVPEGSALGNGQCTTSVDSTTNGTRIRFGSASVSATSTTTSSGQKVGEKIGRAHV